jgi:hypothetical protein
MSPAILPSRRTVLHGPKPAEADDLAGGAQVPWPLDHTLVAGGR